MATPFTPRKRAAIRDTILANWQARYRAIGLDLLIVRGSDAYMQADAFALELEGIEAQAAQTRNEILPDKASSAGLDRHGFVDGVPRRTATRARFTVQGVCAAGVTLNVANKVVQSADGLVYVPEVATVTDTDANGIYEVPVKANTPGTNGNLPAGATLQWSTTPVNALSSAVSVLSVTTTAVDDELDGDYALRIILKRQERPGSGNRADWADWALQCDGVAECYVFPLLAPDLSLTTPTLGAVTIMPMGPAQAGGAVNTRLLSPTRCNEIYDYIDGARDASGTPLASGGVQLRPVTIAPGSYQVRTPVTTSLDVTMTVLLAAGYRNDVVTAQNGVGFNLTYVELAGDFTSTGAVDYTGQRVRVYVGPTAARGGYVVREVAATLLVGIGPFNTRLLFDTPLPSMPLNDTSGDAIYPAPTNDDEIRAAVFGYFDTLGPNPGVFARYPVPSSQGQHVVYIAQLADALVPTYTTRRVLVNGVEGVVSVTINTPGGDFTPGVTNLAVVNNLRVLQA